MSLRDPDTARRLEAVAAELRRRVQTVHERVACPKCRAPRGRSCRAMPHGFPANVVDSAGRELKHPHAERLEADGIQRR